MKFIGYQSNLPVDRSDDADGIPTARCACCNATRPVDELHPDCCGLATCQACLDLCVLCGERLHTHLDADGNQSCDACDTPAAIAERDARDARDAAEVAA